MRTIKYVSDLQKMLTGLFLLSLHAAPQKCPHSDGTKTLYQPQQQTYTVAPTGYSPVFINHVGRHGARHLTKDVYTYTACKMLKKADSLKALTPTGNRVWAMVRALREIEAKGLKSISERGKTEQQGIAARMVKNFPAIFSRNALNLHIEATKEIRTTQSADAFLDGLQRTVKDPVITKVIDDTALRFYDFSPAYSEFEKTGNWKKQLAEIEVTENNDLIFSNFSARMFRASFQPSKEERRDFCMDIYGFASIMPSIEKEAGVEFQALDFFSLFTCDELTSLSRIDQAEDYFVKGPGMDSMGIQVKIAAPLLVQFITSTDDFISAKTSRIALRFAHAETISPFAALLQIQSASRSALTISPFHADWNASEIIPLSANIQWIIYRKNNSTDYLVKILLNEKESAIKGLKTDMYPFYHWNALREFYVRLLGGMNVNLDDSMTRFLSSVKSSS